MQIDGNHNKVFIGGNYQNLTISREVLSEALSQAIVNALQHFKKNRTSRDALSLILENMLGQPVTADVPESKKMRL